VGKGDKMALLRAPVGFIYQSSVLKIEAASSSETSVLSCQST
jgi:hypothetical protein